MISLFLRWEYIMATEFVLLLFLLLLCMLKLVLGHIQRLFFQLRFDVYCLTIPVMVCYHATVFIFRILHTNLHVAVNCCYFDIH